MEDDDKERLYEWLRQPAFPSDTVPINYQWRIYSLVKDIDKRLQELED